MDIDHPSTAEVETPPGADSGADRFQRVMAIFERAMAADGAAREDVLTRECEGDVALRKEVAAMLRHAAAPAEGLTAGGGLQPEVVGRIIGRGAHEGARALMPLLKGEYNLLGTVGQGGMGVVYRAEQSIPRRIVAIKAIRPGLTSRQVLRRFEHEAHILGRLQHPGIAQVFEAGAASSARADEAFFVMEFVDGVAITEFARSGPLSVEQRLELIAKVCDAVQHAHQRRVIHRDLKPGNILVTKEGQPKILDFGVARLEDEAESITRQTNLGQLIGTLAYMAPEQLEGAVVDARADVYALGVILYQLLSGRLPHEFKGSSLLEAARLLRDEQPIRLGSLDPSLRGDVEIIVQKAAERDRERRYQSAADLAADIRRHLRGEPIQARADSAVYVIRKQLSRHKGVTAAIILAILGLAAFAVYASVQSSREMAAKVRADANAERYRAELSVTNIERGRLLGVTGNFPAAEQLIWNEHTQSPSDLSYWGLWELYSRMPTRATLGGHQREVRFVAASPDGASVATVCLSEVHLWDPKTWTRTRVMTLDSDVRRPWYTPDSQYILTATATGDIGVFRAGTGERVGRAHVPGSGGIAVAPSGPAPWPVAVIGLDSIVYVFQLGADGQLTEDGVARSPQRWNTSTFNPITINAARTLLVVGSYDGEVRAWRLDTREQCWSNREHNGIIGGLAFSSDGKRLATGANDRVMLLYDVDGLEIRPSAQHSIVWDNGTVRCLEFSHDGKYLLAAGYWWTEVWDLHHMARTNEFVRCQERGGCAVWLNDDSMILATGSSNVARVWEARPNGHLRSINAPGHGVWALALSPDGQLLASGGNDGSIRVWHYPSMEPAFDLLKQDSRVRILEFSKDGRTLLSAGGDGMLRLWDMESHHCRATIENPGQSYREFYSAFFTPDQNEIVTAARDQLLRIYDSKTSNFKAALEDRQGDGHVSAAMSGDGRFLASSHGNTLSLWKYPASGAPMLDMTENASGWRIEWLPDNRRVAVGTWDSTVEIWDISTGKIQQTLAGHTQIISALAIGPALNDGSRMLVSGSWDGQIKLWNANTGSCLLTLFPDAGSIAGLIATPDGKTIISGHENGTIGIWDMTHYDAHIQAAAAFHVPESR